MFDRFLKNKWSIFIYTFLLFSIGSFGIAFFPPDEPKYVDAALRMIETGNYIVPFFNCHVRFDKPILYYWELVAFFKLFSVDQLIKIGKDPFGIIEYAARLPSIITGAIAAVYVYRISKMLFDKKVARFSVVGFLSSIFFFYLPRAVYPDMSLILFELMGLYYFIENKYCLGWIFTALAFLVKGPIGIVSVGFTYFIYLWVVKRRSGVKEFFSLKNGAGFVLFFIISFPWYFEVYKKYGMEFVNRFFLYHNIERFTGAAHQHPHSFFYFFPIAIVAVYLWWPYMLDFAGRINFKDDRVKFLFLWFLWVFLFFSISRNKLPHYIAFAFIPLSVLFGLYIERIRYSKAKTYSMFVLDMVIAASVSFYLHRQGLDSIIPEIIIGFLFIAVINFIKKPVVAVFYRTVALSIVAFVVLLQLNSYRAAPLVWREVTKTHLPLVEYRVFNESLVAYSRMCLVEYKKLSNLPKEGKYLLYTKQSFLSSLANSGMRFDILYSNMIDRGKRTALLLINGS